MKKSKSRSKKNWIWHALILGSAAIWLARLQFLPAWVYAVGVRLTPKDAPYDLIIHWEKAIFTVLIYLGVRQLYGVQLIKNKKTFLKTVLIAIAAAAIIIIGPALLVHYMVLEPKIPGILPVWIFNNLFLTCIVEELFFRNYVYEATARLKLFKKPSPQTVALVASALIFGANHFRGGGPYVFLASLAGLVFASAYIRAGLAASIAVHFLVNLVHILLFSYPTLQR